MIQRTQQWLAGQHTSFINERATNSDVLRITAYIAWSLENTGCQRPAVEKAKQFVGQHMTVARMGSGMLTRWLCWGLRRGLRKDRAFTRQAMQLLLDARAEKDEQAWWTAQDTGAYATGASAGVETTGLTVQAFLKWGQVSSTASKALTYIASKKEHLELGAPRRQSSWCCGRYYFRQLSAEYYGR